MSVESQNQIQSDEEFIADLLLKTSRTFALAIPLLAKERRRQIGLSYLLFRVADCIEDAPEGDATTKRKLLSTLQSCFRAANDCKTERFELEDAGQEIFNGLWPAHSPNSRLLLGLPRLIDVFNELPTSISQSICKALQATIAGMIGFIECSSDSPHQIQIQTLGQLRLYCYAVAGIVGEMLTDIFVDDHPVDLRDYKELRRLSVGFGEFLQLINILKDSHQDANNGRVFIPVDATREAVHQLALGGRRDAVLYIGMLQKHRFPEDIIHFCRFIFLLADGSMEKLVGGGAGSKLTREEVSQILSDVKLTPDFLTNKGVGHGPQASSELTL